MGWYDCGRNPWLEFAKSIRIVDETDSDGTDERGRDSDGAARCERSNRRNSAIRGAAARGGGRDGPSTLLVKRAP